MEIDHYTPEFSPRLFENRQRVTGMGWPCFICGKAIKSETARYWVRTYGGLQICTDEYAEAHLGGDSGSYPIGADCRRKLPEHVRHLVTDTKRRAS